MVVLWKLIANFIQLIQQEVKNAVQCWNERGCKRDENYLFLPFFENLYGDSLREALKQVINDYLGVSVSFELRSSNSILGTRCESILAPISLQQSCSYLLTEQLIM